MTSQPPPPPPGGAPPPPPPGGGSPAPFDPKSVNPLDWGIVAAGAILFLFSFIAYYDGGDVTVNGKTQDIPDAYSESFSAWHDIVGGGFFGWFGMVFGVAGAVVVALALFRPQVSLPVPHRLAGLGLFAASALFEILTIFVTPSYDLGGLTTGDVESSAGHGFGYFVSLLAAIAGLGLSLMRFQATGGQLPGNLQGKVPNVGGYGPQGGITGGSSGGPQPGPGTQPPPPPGGTPPPPPSDYGPPR